MLYTNIYDVNEWKDEVIEMKAQGFSTRYICRSLFSNENYRNRLNAFFKREDIADEIYHQACQIELNKQIETGVSANDYTDWEVKEKPPIAKSEPRTLYYDIETTLAKSYHFNYWKTNIGVKQMIDPSHMLSHAWCWGEDGEVFSSILTQKEALAKDDERIVLEAWTLFDKADIIVAHNGKRFDVGKCNGYFLKYGLPKPSPFKVIDTLEIAKRNFNLPFKSLEYLAKFLNVELKLDAGGLETWIGCERGDQEALDTMVEYNRGDIVTLREIHKRLKGWDNNGVNIALYNDEHNAVCTHCGSADVSVLTDKYAYTPQRKYQVYRCGNCSAILRGNKKEGIGNSLVRVI
jgi:uncharacterized protein YprB with RNaseH-like and TPR domain